MPQLMLSPCAGVGHLSKGPGCRRNAMGACSHTQVSARRMCVSSEPVARNCTLCAEGFARKPFCPCAPEGRAMHGVRSDEVPWIEVCNAIFRLGAVFCVYGRKEMQKKGKKSLVLSPCFGPQKRRPFSGHVSRANKVRPNCWASPFWHQERAHFPGPKIGPWPGAILRDALGLRFSRGQPSAASPVVYGLLYPPPGEAAFCYGPWAPSRAGVSSAYRWACISDPGPVLAPLLPPPDMQGSPQCF